MAPEVGPPSARPDDAGKAMRGGSFIQRAKRASERARSRPSFFLLLLSNGACVRVCCCCCCVRLTDSRRKEKGEREGERVARRVEKGRERGGEGERKREGDGERERG